MNFDELIKKVKKIKRVKGIIVSDIDGYGSYLLKVFVVTGIIFLAVLMAYRYFWAPFFEIACNKSTSLPQKLFFIVKNMPIKRGNYIAFYPPHNPLYSEERGRRTPFLKMVGGIEGDVVSNKKREFYVNGIDMGYAHFKAANGKTLYAGKTGVIGHDEYYVYTKNPRSYDSRYKSIGWIQKKDVEGRAFPLF
jgi:conjugal transfer pilin signal peptidase TrbI